MLDLFNDQDSILSETASFRIKNDKSLMGKIKRRAWGEARSAPINAGSKVKQTILFVKSELETTFSSQQPDKSNNPFPLPDIDILHNETSHKDFAAP